MFVFQLTQITNAPVGISFVVDTGKTEAVHTEGCRSDGSRLQGPAFGGDRLKGSRLLYAHLDPLFERVEKYWPLSQLHTVESGLAFADGTSEAVFALEG